MQHLKTNSLGLLKSFKSLIDKTKLLRLQDRLVYLIILVVCILFFLALFVVEPKDKITTLIIFVVAVLLAYGLHILDKFLSNYVKKAL